MYKRLSVFAAVVAISVMVLGALETVRRETKPRVHAQSTQVSTTGSVIDSHGRPIEGAIEVLVVNSFGKPIGKVNVEVRNIRSGQSFRGSTDEDGLARIRVPSGQYRISGPYTRRQVSDLRGEPIVVEEGKTKQVRCVPDAVSKVKGTVRDKGGNPLAGVKVEVALVGCEAVATDADGRFVVCWYTEMAGPKVTTFVLVARDAARNLAEVVEVDQRTGNLDLKLKPGVILAGTVLDQEGRPLAGVRVEVSIRMPGASVPLGPIEEVATREDGTFDMKAIPSRHRYEVTALGTGYGPSNVSVTASSKGGSRQDIGPFKLFKLALANLSISGTVVDTHDQPVVGAMIFTAGGQLRTGIDIRTDADGKFVIHGVKSGSILVIASTPGPAPAHGSVWTEGGASNVRIVVAK